MDICQIAKAHFTKDKHVKINYEREKIKTEEIKFIKRKGFKTKIRYPLLHLTIR